MNLFHTKAAASKRDMDVQPPVKRWAQTLLQRYTARNERMRVCETLPLGGRRSLVLVEVDGQRFLAGMSGTGVETLVAMDAVSRREEERA